MLGFHLYKPPEDWACTEKEIKLIGKLQFDAPDPKVREFAQKMHDNAGLKKEGTYLPPGISRAKDGKTPMDRTITTARCEAEEVMFTCVRELMNETKLNPKDIDILICNCSLFNPTPSLASMIINHFKMRSDVIVYNLGGMGCSAGVISLSLCNELLQVHPNSRAIVMSTENITQNYYFGTNRSMFIPNALFRVGGAAIMLSNRSKDHSVAKYKLMHLVRTHIGAKDEAYKCVFQQEDPEGNVGVKLDRSLMKIAGEALKKNIEVLGTLALPFSEQLKYVSDQMKRKRDKNYRENTPEFVPDFKKAFKHFCIHAGGRGVLDSVQESLDLSDEMLKPSRKTLYYFGNTSSSSVWYELGWMESYGRIKEGDKVWQIAFGSGFKCNSAVWLALRNVRTLHRAWTTEEESPLLTKSYKGDAMEPEGEDAESLSDASDLADAHLGELARSTFNHSFKRGDSPAGVRDVTPSANKSRLLAGGRKRSSEAKSKSGAFSKMFKKDQ